MNKTMLKRLTLFALALLTVGGANAATETYDFSTLSTGQYTASSTTSCDKVNSQNMNLLKIGTETFNNRFAVSRAGTTTANNAWETKAYSTHSGLFSCYDARYFTILGLHDGDKINIVWSTESSNGASLKFYEQPALNGVSSGVTVTSGSEYTVNTDAESVNINLVTDKGSETDGQNTKVYIKSVTIERLEVTVPITINVIPDATTEEYDLTATELTNNTNTTAETTNKGKVNNTDINVLQLGTTTYDRFAVSRVGQSNGWVIKNYGNATEKGLSSQYNNRYFTILNLKDGDKITINWATAGSGSLNFYDAPATSVEVSAGAAVVSGTVYTISTVEESVNVNLYTVAANEDTKGENAKVCIYSITIDPAAAHVGNYIGATLVSSYALDFTDVSEVNAYVATAASGDAVTFTKVSKVAANTPLYIKVNATSGSAINVEIPEATEGAVDYSATNLLKGSASSSTDLTSNGSTNYYVYGVKGNVPGWYLVTDGESKKFTSDAGKAYLEVEVPAAASARSYMSMYFDDKGTTGIEAVKQPAVQTIEGDGYWYNLQGQRVENPTKGIYIRNGKKVFIK